eukprot:jgi/Hompol1/6540/HPOL_005012-RA
MTLLGNFSALNTIAEGPFLDFSAAKKQIILVNTQSQSQPQSSHPAASQLSSGATLVGQFSANETVTHVCHLDPSTIIFGGQIASLSGVAVSNIFAYDLGLQKADSMQGGIVGSVKSMLCVPPATKSPSAVLWISSANVPVYVASASVLVPGTSLSYLSVWSNGTWISAPGGGLNGPVNALAVETGGAVIAAGSFTGTADGASSVPPLSQMVSIQAGNILSSGVVNASILACPSSNNGWYTLGPKASIDIQLASSITLTGLAVRNMVSATDGVRVFSMSSPATAPGVNYSLIAVDPLSGRPTAPPCTACVLPKDNTTHLFIVANPDDIPQSNDVRLDVIESYGLNSTGLSSIQLFQRG